MSIQFKRKRILSPLLVAVATGVLCGAGMAHAQDADAPQAPAAAATDVTRDYAACAARVQPVGSDDSGQLNPTSTTPICIYLEFEPKLLEKVIAELKPCHLDLLLNKDVPRSRPKRMGVLLTGTEGDVLKFYKRHKAEDFSSFNRIADAQITVAFYRGTREQGRALETRYYGQGSRTRIRFDEQVALIRQLKASPLGNLLGKPAPSGATFVKWDVTSADGATTYFYY